MQKTHKIWKNPPLIYLSTILFKTEKMTAPIKSVRLGMDCIHIHILDIRAFPTPNRGFKNRNAFKIMPTEY